MLPIQIHQPLSNTLSRFRNEFDRLFDRFPTDDDAMSLVGTYPVDIHEDADRLYVDAELPGFTKDQVNVTLENGMLTIAAERDADKCDKTDKTMHLHERRYTRVVRRFTLPNTIGESNVSARLENGVLHLTLNKREEVKPRQITVQ